MLRRHRKAIAKLGSNDHRSLIKGHGKPKEWSTTKKLILFVISYLILILISTVYFYLSFTNNKESDEKYSESVSPGAMVSVATEMIEDIQPFNSNKSIERNIEIVIERKSDFQPLSSESSVERNSGIQPLISNNSIESKSESRSAVVAKSELHEAVKDDVSKSAPKGSILNEPHEPHEPHKPKNMENLDATVIGFGAGYDIDTYKLFVGSLRASGFGGNIIVGLSESAPWNIISYLDTQNVKVEKLKLVNCTYDPIEYGIIVTNGTVSDHTKNACVHPYTNFKIGWARYPLARAWLRKTSNSGPVLLTNIKNVYFQKNPFSSKTLPINNLQVFEEHPDLTTDDWRVFIPLGICKSFLWRVPLLTSSAVLGIRSSIEEYLAQMAKEMKKWTQTKACRFNFKGNSQAIHNFHVYNGNIAATVFPHRTGLLHSVRVDARNIRDYHVSEWKLFNNTEEEAMEIAYHGANENTWISSETRLTDIDGYFLNIDGSKSSIIVNFDVLGKPFYKWLNKQSFMQIETHPDELDNEEKAENIFLTEMGTEGYSDQDSQKMKKTIIKLTSQIISRREAMKKKKAVERARKIRYVPISRQE